MTVEDLVEKKAVGMAKGSLGVDELMGSVGEDGIVGSVGVDGIMESVVLAGVLDIVKVAVRMGKKYVVAVLEGTAAGKYPIEIAAAGLLYQSIGSERDRDSACLDR